MIAVPVTNEPMTWLGWLGLGISKCGRKQKADVRSVEDGSDSMVRRGQLLGVSALHYSTGNMEGLEGFGRWIQLMHCA